MNKAFYDYFTGYWSVTFCFSFSFLDAIIQFVTEVFNRKKMVLDFEYGINTGNRFLDLVDHDEDPEDLIARQTQPEEKPKKSKDAKTVSSAITKKSASKTTTTPAAGTTSASTAKTNKENLTGKSTTTDQRRQQTNVLSDNNNQQPRGDSARGKTKNLLIYWFVLTYIYIF